MADSPGPKVFISYAWKNQPVAKQLQRDLQRDGVEVFVDYEKITGGDSLPARISAALDWCNTVLLLWSTDSAQSFWVSQEWESAFQLQKRIIPCVLDGTPLPALLRSKLYLNFSPYETGYAPLCRSLGVEPKIATPAPLPPSTLQPQHVEFPVGDQTPPPIEAREKPPPAKQKPESPPAKPAKKPKRWQPLVNRASVGSLRSSAAARRVSAWLPRGKVMNITFAVILVAVAVAVYKMCQEQPTSTSQKSVAADSLGVASKVNADTMAKAPAQKPKEQKPPVGTEQASKSNVERKRTSEPVTSIRQSVPSLHLRSTGKTLSDEETKTMLAKYGFYDSDWYKDGKGITHQYEVINRSGKKLVFDRTTDLTWQQSGSEEYMTYDRANVYVDSLRQVNYGGYPDWRLPTLEEAMSLMEREKKNGDLYIDPKFDQTQRWIWTADTYNAGVAWVVSFINGDCGHHRVDIGGYYVRAVRGGQ
jgi:TIR domain/Protein of unknown function (DUF1566)